MVPKLNSAWFSTPELGKSSGKLSQTEKAQKFYEVSSNDKQAFEITCRAVRQSLKLKHQIPNLFHSDEFREFHVIPFTF